MEGASKPTTNNRVQKRKDITQCDSSCDSEGEEKEQRETQDRTLAKEKQKKSQRRDASEKDQRPTQEAQEPQIKPPQGPRRGPQRRRSQEPLPPQPQGSRDKNQPEDAKRSQEAVASKSKVLSKEQQAQTGSLRSHSQNSRSRGSDQFQQDTISKSKAQDTQKDQQAGSRKERRCKPKHRDRSAESPRKTPQKQEQQKRFQQTPQQPEYRNWQQKQGPFRTPQSGDDRGAAQYENLRFGPGCEEPPKRPQWPQYTQQYETPRFGPQCLDQPRGPQFRGPRYMAQPPCPPTGMQDPPRGLPRYAPQSQVPRFCPPSQLQYNDSMCSPLSPRGRSTAQYEVPRYGSQIPPRGPQFQSSQCMPQPRQFGPPSQDPSRGPQYDSRCSPLSQNYLSTAQYEGLRYGSQNPLKGPQYQGSQCIPQPPRPRFTSQNQESFMQNDPRYSPQPQCTTSSNTPQVSQYVNVGPSQPLDPCIESQSQDPCYIPELHDPCCADYSQYENIDQRGPCEEWAPQTCGSILKLLDGVGSLAKGRDRSDIYVCDEYAGRQKETQSESSCKSQTYKSASSDDYCVPEEGEEDSETCESTDEEDRSTTIATRSQDKDKSGSKASLIQSVKKLSVHGGQQCTSGFEFLSRSSLSSGRTGSFEFERGKLGLQAGAAGDSLPMWVSPSRTIGDIEREMMEIHDMLLDTPNRKLIKVIERISDLEIAVKAAMDKNVGVFDKFSEAYKQEDQIISDKTKAQMADIQKRITEEDKRAAEALSKTNGLKNELKVIDIELKKLEDQLAKKTKSLTAPPAKK